MGHSLSAVLGTTKTIEILSKELSAGIEERKEQGFSLLVIDEDSFDLLNKDAHDSEEPYREFAYLTQSIFNSCLLYTSPSPRDQRGARMPSSA